MGKNNTRFTTVSIPKPLGEKAKKLIKNTGFTSLSGFVEYILREIVSEKETTGKNKKEEIKGVEEKLRRLGYM
jgi:metal-responsive CopG/Arc/MetJ family transcriptional regulator